MTPTDPIGDDVTLYRGDCLAVLPKLEPAYMGVVTDPPFGIAYSSGHGGESWGDGSVAGDGDTSARDRMLEWAVGCELPILCFGSWRVARPAGTRALLVWDTLGALGMGDLRLPWKPSHQEIYALGNANRFTGERGTDVIQHPPVQSMAKNGRVHPMEKPVGLLRKLIRKIDADVIVDPFMGSGSTGVAAIREGKRFIGIELDPAHYATALRRLTYATGAGPGQLFAALEGAAS